MDRLDGPARFRTGRAIIDKVYILHYLAEGNLIKRKQTIQYMNANSWKKERRYKWPAE